MPDHAGSHNRMTLPGFLVEELVRSCLCTSGATWAHVKLFGSAVMICIGDFQARHVKNHQSLKLRHKEAKNAESHKTDNAKLHKTERTEACATCLTMSHERVLMIQVLLLPLFATFASRKEGMRASGGSTSKVDPRSQSNN